jgi:outer membrane lipoprotein carrier protein
MRPYLSYLLWLMSCIPVATAAPSAPQQLDAFLRQTQSFRAEFQQTVRNPQGTITQQGYGTVMFVRPGRFRWEYHKPYEQLIVSDGRRLWIYDPDLEQVTVKPMDTALGSTPALLLSTVRPLEQDFTIRDQGSAHGLSWVELVPKAEDTSFERVRVGLAGQRLQQMELYDNFGQVTRLKFANSTINPSLDAELFRFVPPPGVDVVGDS